MTIQISRRMMLAGLFSSAALPAARPALADGPTTKIRPRHRPEGLMERMENGGYPTINMLLERNKISGHSAFALAALSDGQILEGHEAHQPLPPASVAKTLTTLYALDTLGPEYRFTTRLLGTGPMEGGKLVGDLILAGGGDPDFDTDNLGELAAGLKAAGVTEVTGKFFYYGHSLPEARLIDIEQPAHVAYNPGVSGLNLNYNRVHFEWKKVAGKWAITMDARAGKYRPDVTIASMALADRTGPIFTYNDRNGHDEWTVAESALGTADGARWLPVRRPAAYTAEVFQTLARAYGIVLDTPEEMRDLPVDAFQLASYQSRPLSKVIKEMLYYSTNLTAEIIGLTASVARGVAPTSLRDSAQAMSVWAKQAFGLTEVSMVDHSGLEDDSRISTADLVTMLASRQAQDQLRPLLKDINLRKAGKVIDKNRPMTVQAKTGTLNFVSGLAGYVVGPDGTAMAFAVLSGDIEIRKTLPMEQRERPPGGRPWLARARNLQQDLIERWGGVYGTG
ncbi:D-alanyl-D-alanine carboxypeptidase/D-alanyl-D-alanine endopeptidase [Pseudooceanicola spongiae]|uniref:D-alanyl-D-alanine carboxypeptidase/D-alanyl-D-alanine-endopeptidase n=1 Tax=Pseudooceanicola spongiae TaxID=2613965 RepID=A0A7L9WNK3_9RHOB|nr:D-alanyl-D-alanine carboxypeptidase/D-alanyl-D-alanine-endopeptidase [Pseudooceanicola spongiae]QOL81513.1 D-alanyl-D-alanine carboxypeptidase/D-alanyl-D-alanine-endopeptidase [Pseudooceanicola spongiae]